MDAQPGDSGLDVRKRMDAQSVSHRGRRERWISIEEMDGRTSWESAGRREQWIWM